ERQAERLHLLLLHPQRRRLTAFAEDAQAERAMARLAERLCIEAGSEAEFDGHRGSMYASRPARECVRRGNLLADVMEDAAPTGYGGMCGGQAMLESCGVECGWTGRARNRNWRNSRPSLLSARRRRRAEASPIILF